MVNPVKNVLEGRKKVLNEKELKVKLKKKKVYEWKEKKQKQIKEGVKNTKKYVDKIL